MCWHLWPYTKTKDDAVDVKSSNDDERKRSTRVANNTQLVAFGLFNGIGALERLDCNPLNRDMYTHARSFIARLYSNRDWTTATVVPMLISHNQSLRFHFNDDLIVDVYAVPIRCANDVGEPADLCYYEVNETPHLEQDTVALVISAIQRVVVHTAQV